MGSAPFGTWPLAILGVALGACAASPGRAARVDAARFEVQGHRGCRGLRPENTMAAFEHAIALGVDVLELDLALSKDDVLMVVHDPEVSPAICTPAAAHPLPSLRYRDLTAEQIATIDCVTLRNPRFPEQTPEPGAPIPWFEEVLALLERNPRLRANAEIKTFPDRREVTRTPDDFARAFVTAVRARALERRVTVQSFDPVALEAMARLGPEIERVALVERAEDIEPMLATGARVLSPRASLVDAAFVRRFQDRGLRVVPWTVNETAEMRRLIGWGVDGIITDRPDLLIEIVRRPP